MQKHVTMQILETKENVLVFPKPVLLISKLSSTRRRSITDGIDMQLKKNIYIDRIETFPMDLRNYYHDTSL